MSPSVVRRACAHASIQDRWPMAGRGPVVPLRRQRSRLTIVPALAIAAVACLGSSPLAAASAGAPSIDAASVAAAGADAGGAGSIQAEQLAAHRSDPISVSPGDRVDVPFVPVADEGTVGGTVARALPAGRASGRDMAREQTGSVWASPSETVASGPLSLATEPGAATDGASPASAGPQAFVGTRKQVIGFLPYWELGASINYRVVTTVAYFCVDADQNGNLLKTSSGGSLTAGWAGWTSSAMSSVIGAAHSNGDRVVLTVDMMVWDAAGRSRQAAFLNSSAAQLNLARQIAAAVRDRGADGVNLDFEPIVSGGGPGFAAFVRTLRAQLNAVAAGYQLTLDAVGSVGALPLSQLNSDGAADAVMIMGYDFRLDGAASAGSIDPLTSSSAYDLDDAVDAFVAKMPASKVILGLPWYGRAWSTTSNGLRAATHSGSTYGYSVPANYDVAVSLAAQYGLKYDAGEQSAWTAYYGTWGTSPTWRELYWDNPQAEAAKADFINARGLRGAGIWALGYEGGSADLYNVLAAKFPTTSAVSFTYPTPGHTTIVTSTNNTIAWSISAPSGVRSVTLVEQAGKRVSRGSCSGVTWKTVWTQTGKKSPLALSSFSRDYCWRWNLSVVDGTGRTLAAQSGSLLVATVPAVSWTYPPVGKTSIGGASNTIRWAVSDPSGITASTIQEWRGSPVNGTCSGVAWTSNWIGSYPSPLYSWGYTPGCYLYTVRATSGNGIPTQSNSGTLLVH